ncbi:chitinase 10 [Daucus carota subsp. sativus]|uniref:chitinase 10 n=1 Tax=Daucus carota subsp. sativus TaxID=79200 RepID=UPI0007EFBFB2|nr:PREDICTED: chitinase 10-like [Daucus carota subsp. sativus]
MAPPLSIPLLLLTILVFSSTLFSSSEARNGIKISSLISQDLYNSIFLHKDDSACPAKDFYPYSAFIEATERFPRFGSCGSLATRKREIAAFLAQISHETTGGWATAPDGPYAWGLCFKEEVSPGSDYCDSSNQQWPCYPNKTYQGRGPIQLSWNYNYGPAGKALGFDGLRTPEIVANNSVIAFKTALWFWMTEQKPKPSCHDVMIGRYKPTAADIAANRTAGFGLVTNIINGGLECGIGSDSRVNDRIGFFQRYAKLFNVDTGSNLDCASQKSF